MEAKGINGQIAFDGDEVVISRKGVMGFLTQGLKGTKSIDVTQISSVQFKNAGIMFNGFIQFAFLGGRETKGGLFDATHDENTVMFRSGQQKAFESIRDAIRHRIQEIRHSEPSTDSVADEIEKLASLLERGLITDEEFQAKKRQILGV